MKSHVTPLYSKLENLFNISISAYVLRTWRCQRNWHRCQEKFLAENLEKNIKTVLFIGEVASEAVNNFPLHWRSLVIIFFLHLYSHSLDTWRVPIFAISICTCVCFSADYLRTARTLKNRVAVINTNASVSEGGRTAVVWMLSRVRRLEIIVPHLANLTNTVVHTYSTEGRWRVCVHATRLIDA